MLNEFWHCVSYKAIKAIDSNNVKSLVDDDT